MNRTILFLCTGNYYRSRFAEEYFNFEAERLGLDWRADSRALAIERGIGNLGPISSDAEQGLAARGITLATPVRMPQALCEADLNTAERIIALKETEHRPLLLERFPDWSNRVEYWEVHDMDQWNATQALEEIERRIRLLVLGLTERTT